MERTSHQRYRPHPKRDGQPPNVHQAFSTPQGVGRKVHEQLRTGDREGVIRQLGLSSSTELDLSSHRLGHEEMQLLCDALRHPDCAVADLTLAGSDAAMHLYECLPFCRSITSLTLTPAHEETGAAPTRQQLQDQGEALAQGLHHCDGTLGTALHHLTIPPTLLCDKLVDAANSLGITMHVGHDARQAADPHPQGSDPYGLAHHGVPTAFQIPQRFTSALLESTQSVKPIDTEVRPPLAIKPNGIAKDLNGTFSFGLFKRLQEHSQRIIDLRGERLGQQGAYCLRDLLFLDKQHLFQILDLRGCAIEPKGYSDIFYALHERSSAARCPLKELHLSGNALNLEYQFSRENLCKALSGGCLRSLRLSQLDAASTQNLSALLNDAQHKGWKCEIWLDGECVYRPDVEVPWVDHYHPVARQPEAKPLSAAHPRATGPKPQRLKPDTRLQGDAIIDALRAKDDAAFVAHIEAAGGVTWPAAHLSVSDADQLAVHVRDNGLLVLDLSGCKSFGLGKTLFSRNAFGVLMQALKRRDRFIPMATLVLDATAFSDADWKKLDSSVKRGDMTQLKLTNVGDNAKLKKRVDGLIASPRAARSITYVDWT